MSDLYISVPNSCSVTGSGNALLLSLVVIQRPYRISTKKNRSIFFVTIVQYDPVLSKIGNYQLSANGNRSRFLNLERVVHPLTPHHNREIKRTPSSDVSNGKIASVIIGDKETVDTQGFLDLPSTQNSRKEITSNLEDKRKTWDFSHVQQLPWNFHGFVPGSLSRCWRVELNAMTSAIPSWAKCLPSGA